MPVKRHGVEYVLIGGVAAELLDLRVAATIDIDVTPSRADSNLQHLADVFDELDAGLLTADGGGTWFPRSPTENWSQYDTLHLTTIHGPLDIVFAPDGAPNGFRDLSGDAIELVANRLRRQKQTSTRASMSRR